MGGWILLHIKATQPLIDGVIVNVVVENLIQKNAAAAAGGEHKGVGIPNFKMMSHGPIQCKPQTDHKAERGKDNWPLPLHIKF